MTLTYDLDLLRAKVHHIAKYLRQRAVFFQKLSAEQTDTHGRLTALAGPQSGR